MADPPARQACDQLHDHAVNYQHALGDLNQHALAGLNQRQVDEYRAAVQRMVADFDRIIAALPVRPPPPPPAPPPPWYIRLWRYLTFDDYRPPHLTASAKDANLRARQLLHAHLTPEQQRQFDAYRDLDVYPWGDPSSLTVYRVHRKRTTNIDELRWNGAQWLHIDSLCVVPFGSVPMDDQLLTQKVMIEADHDVFRSIARHSGLNSIRVDRQPPPPARRRSVR